VFGAFFVAGVFVGLACLERIAPLRRRIEPKLRREARNLAVAGVAAVVLQLAGAPAVIPFTHLVESKRVGLLQLMRLPQWAGIAMALLLMDYTFYWWHVGTHRIPFLWRFHVVHHADLDLDASTALRFHYGELLLGVPFQIAQVVVIGMTPSMYAIWQVSFLSAILFHHSAWRLPFRLERFLSSFLVTPRMHGIHHSVVRRESDANWSSGLNVWDRIHGTMRLNVPQQEITIGVPVYNTPEAVRLLPLLEMPFVAQPPAWRLPDGARPEEHAETAPAGSLLP
jgi:sterol desaturase/sphingolipid hydroxylase (fatty acid hydroxylase superfamily)